MNIAPCEISPTRPPLVIADIGIHHRGDLAVAREMMRLTAGHVVTEADISARRPGSGEIAGYDFDEVVGKRLTRVVTRNTQMKRGDLGWV